MLNPSLKKQFISMFAQVISDLKDKEAVVFINDFFTNKELETYAKRLATSYWLIKGRTGTNIRNNIKISETTLKQIKKMANSKGFRLAIKKIEAEEWANKWAKRLKIM